MATITIDFKFVRGGETQTETNEFDVNAGLVYDCDTFAEEWIEEQNTQIAEELGRNVLPIGEESWELDGYTVEEFDDDFADPANFDDLDEYAEYVEKCEEHGEGYRLRYDDIGEFDFHDDYNGCWNSTEEFAQQLYRDCYDIPDHLDNYIDWESVTRDVMMDYSVYEGREGYHIFRD
jgi:hypothetical protein